MTYPPYSHLTIEPKWRKRWEEAKAFATPPANDPRPKRYILDFFPYPSGAGLHVGHLLGYTGSDVLARVARKQGMAVLHPMGWDAFGLPAENYAIKSGVHPSISTMKNIAAFKHQVDQAGISYDWDHEINSSSPEYYKWTQWAFQLLYNRGLAYKKKGLVNWCPSCQTVLANEQVVAGRCDRCGTLVAQRELEQWYLKITAYAEALLDDLEGLDWPERIKAMQRNWIGKSTGATLRFAVEDSQHSVEVFTTRPDTLYGATFLVIAPEHPLAAKIVPASHSEMVLAYQEATSRKTELERTFLEREKTGVFTGSYAHNPASGERIPIWMADYVLASYGTGAVMAVPAHDERDFVLATQFNLPIRRVIAGDTPLPSANQGTLIDSGEFTGRLSSEVALEIAKKAGGTPTTTYRLRDWLISRQRFWGAPIPIRYRSDGTEELVPESELPIELPMDVQFLPTGQSPLATATSWNTYTVDGVTYRRETDTIDGFLCSSWYFLRFANPHYNEGPFDPEAVAHWLPVDTYIGGAEHAVLHLLYARFFTKVLYDAGLISFKEPFKSLRNQGMILGPDHNKMSKSKGNVISPDEVVARYGADTLRVYELFMGPFDVEKPWNTSGIAGARRFLERVWRLGEKVVPGTAMTKEEAYLIHPLIAKVSYGIERLSFNTSIAAMMESLNSLSAQKEVSEGAYLKLVTLLNPFAPYLTEELWQHFGQEGFCSLAPWPAVDTAFTEVRDVEYAIQIDGKVRAKLSLPADTAESDVLAAVRSLPIISDRLIGRQVIRELVVPGRLVSLVTAVADSK